MKRINMILLKFGALQTLLMAVYHFFIPTQFDWNLYLEDHSPTINWSLLSLNNYFSYNLFVISLFLLYFLFKRQKNDSAIKILSLIILLFWLFSSIYQIVEPMPLPAHLQWLSYLLFGIAIFNSSLFVIPLVKMYRTNKSNSQ